MMSFEEMFRHNWWDRLCMAWRGFGRGLAQVMVPWAWRGRDGRRRIQLRDYRRANWMSWIGGEDDD